VRTAAKVGLGIGATLALAVVLRGEAARLFSQRSTPGTSTESRPSRAARTGKSQSRAGSRELDRLSDDDEPQSDAGEPFSLTRPAHQRWLREGKDLAWAPRFERGVREIFEDPDLDRAVLVDVDCRATLCRVEMTYDSTETFRALVRICGTREPLASAKHHTDIGPNRIVTYVTPAELASAG
jgi:hypothetical protein